MNEPKLIKGGLAVDDRGCISFVNDFNFSQVKRFYMVENHTAGFIRAWHGHRNEGKYIYVVSGSAKIAAIPIPSLEQNNKDNLVEFSLSSRLPAVLWIPPGYANGCMTLTEDARVMFFSTSTLEESLGDDVRFSADKIPGVWEIEYR